MESWVYIFSKFTPEALLFEGLIICVLCSGYAAFWVLKKRRLGVAQTAVPASVVKTYLTALINDAEQMRSQLFGLLKSAGVAMPSAMINQAIQAEALAAAMEQASAAGTGAVDPNLVKKVALLEGQMAEQNKAMQSLLTEKQKIEAELKAARGNAKAAPAPSGDAAVAELQKQMQLLQSKLDEYSVIEDDLANLKRLQQENAQLKAALGGAPVPAAAPAEAPAETAQAESAEAPEAAPAEAPAATTEAAASAVEADILGTTAPANVENFEGIVDKVEQSLDTETAPAAEAAPVAEAPAPQAQPAAPAPTANTASAPAPEAAAGGTPQPTEASDADLVAEFEKMLNA
jgi:hypothetical protein